jgi:hypothetical protein
MNHTVELRFEEGRGELSVDGQRLARVTNVQITAKAGDFPRVVVELAPASIRAAITPARVELPADLCTALEALGWTRPEETPSA